MNKQQMQARITQLEDERQQVIAILSKAEPPRLPVSYAHAVGSALRVLGVKLEVGDWGWKISK